MGAYLPRNFIGVFYEASINIFSYTGIIKMSLPTSSVEQICGLNQRLNKAEAQLKLLTKEIADIRRKMLQLQKNNPIETRSYSTIANDFTEPDFNPPSKRIKTDFTYENDHVVVYTDGACENNGQRGAKAGLGVWFAEDHALNVSEPVKGKPTNNSGEIQACIKAVEIALANDISQLCIKTDSQFVISSMTSWIKKWKRNNWKLTTGGDVKNKIDFQKLDNLCQRMESVKWVHVPGHQGIKGNEEADKLARNGALRYKT